MSYIRWSPSSDVYVFESDHGFETWVSRTRYRFAVPLPRAPWGWTIGRPWLARLVLAYDLFLRALQRRVPLGEIGGRFDGGRFIDDSAGECAETLELLADCGYRVPRSAIEALIEMGIEADLAAPQWHCPVCHTDYFAPGECDWCPGVRLVAT